MAVPKDNSSSSGNIASSGPARLRIPENLRETKEWLESRLTEGFDESGDVTMSDEEWLRLREEALAGSRRRAS